MSVHYTHDKAAGARMQVPDSPQDHARRAQQEFVQRSLHLWRQTIDHLFPVALPGVCTWRNVGAIRDTLDCVAVDQRHGDGLRPGGVGSAYKFSPGRGSSDHGGAEDGPEPDTLYLRSAVEPREALYNIVRPARLTFRLPRGPLGEPAYQWAYFWLELEEMQATDIYESKVRDAHVERGRETVCELEPGVYKDIEYWEQNHMGVDESGYERPLPETARPVTRVLRGSYVFFCKGSEYNLTVRAPKGSGYPDPDEGLHEALGEERFVNLIEKLARDEDFR